MRFGWSGWRRWPPWVVGYLGIVFVAASVVVILLGLTALGGATPNWLAALGAVVIGVLLMAAGVRMITAQLSDSE